MPFASPLEKSTTAIKGYIGLQDELQQSRYHRSCFRLTTLLQGLPANNGLKGRKYLIIGFI